MHVHEELGTSRGRGRAAVTLDSLRARHRHCRKNGGGGNKIGLYNVVYSFTQVEYVTEEFPLLTTPMVRLCARQYSI